MSISQLQMNTGSVLVLFHSSPFYLTLFCFKKSVLSGSSVKTILFRRKISMSCTQNLLVQIVASFMKSLVCGAGEMKLPWNVGTDDVLPSFPFSHVEIWLDQHWTKFLDLKIAKSCNLLGLDETEVNWVSGVVRKLIKRKVLSPRARRAVGRTLADVTRELGSCLWMGKQGSVAVPPSCEINPGDCDPPI